MLYHVWLHEYLNVLSTPQAASGCSFILLWMPGIVPYTVHTCFETVTSVWITVGLWVLNVGLLVITVGLWVPHVGL